MQLTINISKDAIFFRSQQEFDQWSDKTFGKKDDCHIQPRSFPCYAEYFFGYENQYCGITHVYTYYYPAF